VHFKDVRLDIAQRVRDGELSYYDAVTQGLYTPLGKGDVDVRAITTTLLSQGYTGWFVLEQDNVMREEPEADGGPRVDAKDSVEFLRAVAAEAAG
jgi:inosose dehydratase